MTKKKFFWVACLVSTSIFYTQTANALSAIGSKLDLTYGKTLYGGSCTVCHANPTGENIAWFAQYANIIRAQPGFSYENIGSYSPAIISAGTKDFDNDGFTVDQEIYGGSFNSGSLASNPSAFFTGSTKGDNGKAFGLATAPAVLSSLTTNLDNSPYITVPVSHKNIVSGTIDYTVNNVTTTATTKFLFNTGGIQPTATVLFVDTAAGSSTPITATSLDADGGSWTVGTDGSISVTITDQGAFDLYTTANFQAEAVARTFNFTPTTIFDAYANVSPYANISPLAVVDTNATIDAYAIVDDYATITANATIGSYAYIGPVYVNAIIDPYVAVNTDTYTQASLPIMQGVVRSRIAITTTAPATGVALGSGGSGGDGSTGGLHCMTTGLGTQGLMFLGLLGTAFLVRRKLN